MSRHLSLRLLGLAASPALLRYRATDPWGGGSHLYADGGQGGYLMLVDVESGQDVLNAEDFCIELLKQTGASLLSSSTLPLETSSVFNLVVQPQLSSSWTYLLYTCCLSINNASVLLSHRSS
jgi:hypothetical protein|eukprot:COSAG06_NODE_2544_length_6701_cov_3.102545_6_plen_122_part_00